MVARCTDKDHPQYIDYGARGITVCQDWLDVAGFVHWCGRSGYRLGLTLERVDNNNGYSPDNCKWATWSEQVRNRRTHEEAERDRAKYKEVSSHV
jgi:hypothetical protein